MSLASRVASAIWRGFEGTPAQLAEELGVDATKVSRAMRRVFRREDRFKRERQGRTFVYFMGRRSARR